MSGGPVKFLSYSTVATRLEVTTKTLRTWIADGRLQPIDLTPDADRRLWRISEDEYSRFVAELIERGEAVEVDP